MKVKYTTIIVNNMEESVKFYAEALGYTVDSRYELGPGGRITLMKGPVDVMFELIESTAYETGFYSVGVDVKDIHKAMEAFAAAGGQITMQPMTTTVGSMAFAQDVNGIRFALIEHH